MYRSAVIIVAILGVLSFGFSSKKLKTPPGTIFLKDKLYIDKTEVGNVHWREFTYWLLNYGEDTAKFLEMLPDTLVWSSKGPALSEYYFRHPMYSYYPVVGISYEQAVAFCEWRTERVNELFQKKPSENPFPGKKIRYRLPTKEEWEFAAAGKLDVALFPYGYKDTVAAKGRWKGARLFNYKYSYDTSKHEALLAEVKSYLGNGFGLYNMIGNVSEMVLEKGVAKGGNYSLPLSKCRIIDEQPYTKPEAWLGFRCVCEVIDE